MMFLRHAAMCEDISWTAIRHADDMHAKVTEEDVKRDAFIHAMSHSVSAAAECLRFSLAHEVRNAESTNQSERMDWFNRGESCGQNYVAYQVIRTAYKTLREYGVLEKHSEIWARIEADPEVKPLNDYMQKLLDDNFLWKVVADHRSRVGEGAH